MMPHDLKLHLVLVLVSPSSYSKCYGNLLAFLRLIDRVGRELLDISSEAGCPLHT